MTQQKQIALITGASRGIGKAIALDFAKNNIDVVLTGRNEKRLIDIHNELQSYDINSYYTYGVRLINKNINRKSFRKKYLVY